MLATGPRMGLHQSLRAVAACATLCVLFLLVPAAAQAKFFCPEVELFYAAGSGGGQDPNQALRDEIERGIGADNLFARSVSYPARAVVGGSPQVWANGIGAVLRAGDVGAYHDSVVDGKNWLRTKAKQVMDNCGDRTKIVLSGWSQGAQVVADVYQELERHDSRAKRIFGVVLFGDPYFNGGSDGGGSSQGDLRHSSGVDGALGRREGYGPARGNPSYRSRVRSYCHRRDPVCQGDRPAVNGLEREWLVSIAGKLAARHLCFCDHFNYDNRGEANDAGRWLSTRIRASRPPGNQPNPGTGAGPGGGGIGGPDPGPITGPPALTAADGGGSLAVQVANFPLGTTHYFCHAGNAPDYPTGGTITAQGQLSVIAHAQSFTGLCPGRSNAWIGVQATDNHDYYSNQVDLQQPATPGASVSASNNNGEMIVQFTGFPQGTTYYFCHSGNPSDYPTGGVITAHGQITISSPNQSFASGLCSGRGNAWIGIQASDNHDYYSNQVNLYAPATPGAGIAVFGSSGQMSLQVSGFPTGTTYFFCHAGPPSQYPTGGSIIGRGQINVSSPNQTFGPLCSGSGNAWIGVQATDGHDYYSNQIAL